jgi:formylglycine-generating enzyme required for sulfatase activity
MHVGSLAWAVGWLTLSAGLAVAASVFGPGASASTTEPVAMVRIGGGSFSMGTEDLSADERPVNTVELAPFEIDRLPVTNTQYAAFLISIGSDSDEHGLLYDVDDPAGHIWNGSGRYAPAAGYEQYPVVGETWPGARAYCEWRGARLPTEAEWERAARGTLGRVYPWGDDPPNSLRARFGFRPNDYLPVGSYPDGATPEGVLDMAGNVWQWTSSLYLPYPYRSDDGREDPNATGARVIRGGTHNAPADMLRSSFRSIGLVPGQMPAGVVGMVGPRPTIGFRCARDAS